MLGCSALIARPTVGHNHGLLAIYLLNVRSCINLGSSELRGGVAVQVHSLCYAHSRRAISLVHDAADTHVNDSFSEEERKVKKFWDDVEAQADNAEGSDDDCVMLS